MKKLLGGICLILVLLATIVNHVPANVPPCDQYLDWCVFTYCRQYYNPADYQRCLNLCAENYVLNCMN